MIAPIDNIQSLVVSAAPGQTSPSGNAAGGSVFGDLLSAAVENVRQTDAEKNQAEYLLATGQLDNPMAASIASAKAGLSVSMLVQLRNRAMDAYSELRNISM